MFFDRAAYKGWAKAALQRNYWRSVAAGLLLAVSLGGLGFRVNLNFRMPDFSVVRDGFSDISASAGELERALGEMRLPGASEIFEGLHSAISAQDFALLLGVFGLIAIVGLLGGFLAIAFRTFVGNPLSLGGYRFFVKNLDEAEGFSGLGCGFSSGLYMRNVGILFLQKLYIFLWSLLFLVPGIMKHYSWYFVPYLTATHPEMDRRTVFAASEALTQGHRMELFVMELSFLGWDILNTFTAGILGIFWLNPYRQGAFAAAYKTLAAQQGL